MSSGVGGRGRGSGDVCSGGGGGSCLGGWGCCHHFGLKESLLQSVCAGSGVEKPVYYTSPDIH